MTITVNAGFSRRERRRRGHFQTFWKNLQGVQIEADWNGDHAPIRAALRAQMPAKEGWVLEGYCLIEPGPEPKPVKVT